MEKINKEVNESHRQLFANMSKIYSDLSKNMTQSYLTGKKEAYEEEAAKKALQNPAVSTPITEVEEAPLEENISIASSHKVDIPEWNTSAAQTTAAPAVRTRVSSSQRVKLPYEDSLSEEDRALIKSVTLKDDGTYDVEWNCSIEALAGCPACKTPSPLTASRCPVCGMQF